MSHATPTLRRFAGNLVGYEAQANPPSPTGIATALPVIEKLQPLLATFMGRAGVHALLCRALVLSRAEVPLLCDVEITANGRLTSISVPPTKLEPTAMGEASEVMLANLIGLLVAFIGQVVTLRLIHEIWPDVVTDNHDLTQQHSHESTN